MGRCAVSRLCAWRVCRTRPLLLLLVYLVKWFADDVVLVPVDGGTPYNVLRLWDGREPWGTGLCVYAGRVVASVWMGGVLVMAQAR